MNTEAAEYGVAIKPRTCAEAEGQLRYFVGSRHTVNKRYLVDLSAYSGNGQCSCKHFEMRLEPLLRRQVQPRQALEQKLAKLKEGQEVWDILRCNHILEARSQFLDDVIQAINEREKGMKGNTQISR